MWKSAVAGLVAATCLATGAPVAADGDSGAEVWRDTKPCSVGFDNTDDETKHDPACTVVNIMQPNGGYTLVLHGQVQPDQMAAFQASGVRHYSAEWSAGNCLASYLFAVFGDGDFVFTDSVRHFTPDGRMTETCHYRPSSTE